MGTASYDGTNYALKVTQKVGTWPVAAHCNSARVYCMSDECYTTETTSTTGTYLYFNPLPAGAVPLISIVWPIDSDNVDSGADATAAAVTGELGILATSGPNARIADPDLFGDIAALNSATPQVLEPCPDSSIYTSTLDFALKTEMTPVMITGGANIVNKEGVALKMLYTMGGRIF